MQLGETVALTAVVDARKVIAAIRDALHDPIAPSVARS